MRKKEAPKLPSNVVLPHAVLVGRPNVGKSSILNWLIRQRLAIVEPTAGVTRDRMTVPVLEEEASLQLTDTGGIGLKGDPLQKQIVEQVEFALRTADVILFVVDVRDGRTPLDGEIARMLRKSGKPVVVLANKADTPQMEAQGAEFAPLGFPVESVSTVSNRGRERVLERLADLLPAPQELQAPPAEAVRVAVVGKRNSGKSTLINRLAGEQRLIVSDLPGTTRDVVDVLVEHAGRTFILVDTAGMRKARSVQDSIEFYAQSRSEGAIPRADVVILLLDPLADISQVDKKIEQMILDSNRPCVIGINKWDLVPVEKQEEFLVYAAKKLPGMSFCPISFLSAKEGTNVRGTLELAAELVEQSKRKWTTGRINDCLRRAWEKRGPRPHFGKRAKLFYATQTRDHPPTITLFVNDPNLVDSGYQRYLENQLRREGPWPEVPIRLKLRGRDQKKA